MHKGGEANPALPAYVGSGSGNVEVGTAYFT